MVASGKVLSVSTPPPPPPPPPPPLLQPQQLLSEDLRDKIGNTVYRGEYQAVDELLRGCGYEHAWLAMYWACYWGRDDVVRLLLKHDVPVDVHWQWRYDSGPADTPLITASGRGHVAIVKMLIDAGASLLIKGKHGRTSLMNAARLGSIDTVRLLSHVGVDEKDDFGFTALRDACRNGHEEVAIELIHKGATITESAMCATIMGLRKSNDEARVRLLNTLIKSGGACTSYVLSYAAAVGCRAMVSALVQHGARVDEIGCWDLTPLMAASARYLDQDFIHGGRAELRVTKYMGTVCELLDHGACTFMTNYLGRTALMMATDASISRLLLGAGADPFHRDKHGRGLAKKLPVEELEPYRLYLLKKLYVLGASRVHFQLTTDTQVMEYARLVLLLSPDTFTELVDYVGQNVFCLC